MSAIDCIMFPLLWLTIHEHSLNSLNSPKLRMLVLMGGWASSHQNCFSKTSYKTRKGQKEKKTKRKKDKKKKRQKDKTSRWWEGEE